MTWFHHTLSTLKDKSKFVLTSNPDPERLKEFHATINERMKVLNTERQRLRILESTNVASLDKTLESIGLNLEALKVHSENHNTQRFEQSLNNLEHLSDIAQHLLALMAKDSKLLRHEENEVAQ